MRPKELKKFLLTAISNNLPILIKGAPGVGKSDIVAQVANELGYHLLISHPVVSDPTDYKGQPWVVDGKATHLPYGDLQQLIDATEPTIFFLDDLGQAPACVQAAAMQLLLARRINGHKISDKVVFIAATNRREDKAGVTGILEPVKSRFASIVELTVSVEDWIEWAMQNDMPIELIGFAYYRASDVFSKSKPTVDIVNHCCPRTLAFAGKLIKAGITSVEALAGAVGDGTAAELVGFLKTYKELPSLNDIKKDPDNVPVPIDIAAKYAVICALINKADKDNIDAFMRYGARFPKDMSILLGRDICKKDPKLSRSNEMSKWRMEHQDILMGDYERI